MCSYTGRSQWPHSLRHDMSYGRAIAQRLVAGFPTRRPGFELRSAQGGFVVDKVTLGQVFSEYFSFP
jgi:hypothetical protein